MPQESIHAIGLAVYFVFLLLFLWARFMPGSHRGAGWWAWAMGCAFTARLLLMALATQQQGLPHAVLYSMLILVEKFCLLRGLARFFDRPIALRSLYLVVFAGEAWVLACMLLDVAAFVRGFGAGLVNAGLLLYAARIAHASLARGKAWLMRSFTMLCLVLALHWTLAFPIMRVVPSWAYNGFLLGTLLVLAQYFCLLALVFASAHQQLLDAKERALDLAFQDPLTNLSNQRYMRIQFDNAQMLARRAQQMLALIYIDLDNFKPINDRAGHRVGDEVLKTMAMRLQHATRGTDICARVGGDEFVAICTQLEHEADARNIAQKLLREFTMPVEVEGRHYQLGASIGISLYPQHGETLDELLEHADKAMYRAKHSGKGGYRMHAKVAAV